MGKKFTFIRTSITDASRYAVEEDYAHIIQGCFSMCTPQARSELEAFLADPKQESIKFEFDNGEMAEVRRE